MADAQEVMARASAARRAGDAPGAERLLRAALAAEPGHPGLYNALGLTLLEARPAAAADCFAMAVALDAGAMPLWLNLADASRRSGDDARCLAALDRALALDPYQLAALVAKGGALERLGRLGEAARTHRALLASAPADAAAQPALARALDHAREAVRAFDEARADRRAAAIEQAMAAVAEDDRERAAAFVDVAFGRRKVFAPRPTGAHYPFLPALEFFPRARFPWFAELEAATGDIRAELTAEWAHAQAVSVPYVRFDATEPTNQWAALNHSPDWSALFLWENGEPNPAALERFPATAALVGRLPLLDTPGRAPTVMFSILKPATRIPPHTGTSNVRATVHLPLIVPSGCGFRVGGSVREWREGEAWAFDDTIEHEAWNDSGQPRTILILDAWNPFLSEAERALVRAAG